MSIVTKPNTRKKETTTTKNRIFDVNASNVKRTMVWGSIASNSHTNICCAIATALYHMTQRESVYDALPYA